MADSPVQRSDAAPAQVDDPVASAQAVVDDPGRKGSPEWLAAMQVLVDQARDDQRTDQFQALEAEMQALRGMSQI